VLVYDGAFADPAVYEREMIDGLEDNGLAFREVWLNLSDYLDPDAPPLYPDGLERLLAETD
jgi:hypothetical protein